MTLYVRYDQYYLTKYTTKANLLFILIYLIVIEQNYYQCKYILQIRLDLTTFVITGPSTVTTIQIRRKFGSPVMDLTDGANQDNMGSSFTGSCLLDTFYATSASPSSSPPVICGTATGEHSMLIYFKTCL